MKNLGKKLNPVQARLTDVEIEVLMRYCRSEGCSVSDAIRVALSKLGRRQKNLASNKRAR